ncbi:hypothetical protein DMN91_003890 [Ooceraea biroi]|uniref:Major facilitator superfamily (MFS) profile domain-containing protein n=1 Tax=Ooceraea biroi TaxID=2015173 RepID=A0A3L8DTH5_OOCBI|nr:hypothetical protein DMN91_003890 [Ooceraea biroi]
MPLERKPMRYAHQEGHTDVCYYSGEKRGLITCGCDGDVRSWLNLMDDDPITSCISEQAITAISKDGKIFVGNDNNTVQILTYPDLDKEGIVTRFSAPVSALATAKDSNLIVSGACDMRIQVTNINTSDSIELEGHEAPILGLTLDPKEEFVASSSADGSIRVWNIKDKRTVHVWNNTVPKCNSFFTAKSYCTPSFKCTDGSYLAYPSNKDIVIVERLSWKELYRLKCPNLKTELSICKFSECGAYIAASSLYGEIVVWNVETKEVIGHLEHEQDTKITALAWHIDHSNEIAFCDAMGKLGCVDVISSDNLGHNLVIADSEKNEDLMENNLALSDDDDGENVISLGKIKASVSLEDDQKSHSDAGSEKSPDDAKTFVPNVKLQSPFQPGSTPSHLLSYFMMWNDVGMVRCFSSEDGEECSIEVEFHDAAVHRSMHINNYLRHSMAALSTQALALSCTASEDSPSKIVVIALQGWGSGNKEWSLDLPEGEESECLAVGDNFVAVATSRRNLRIFMIGGTQREILALPGPVIAMNSLGSHLVIAYHAGIACSPTVVDSEDIVRIYDKASCQWRVLCDVNAQGKGKADHFFVIGVSERERNMRCILCKGSYYPPTTPRPIIIEVPLSIPLCEPEVDICEQIASTRTIDLAIRYATRVNKMALAKKLETIADAKSTVFNGSKREENTVNHSESIVSDDNFDINTQEEDNVPLPAIKTPEVEIKPLAMNQMLKRVNPFLKAENTPLSPRGLAGLNSIPEKPEKSPLIKSPLMRTTKSKSKTESKEESFIKWYAKNKKNLQEEFPDMIDGELLKIGLTRYKGETRPSNADNTTESPGLLKKRKLSSPDNERSNEAKRSTSSVLSKFAFDKIIPESPRWLLAMGKPRQAGQILQKAAGRNKIPLENVKLALEAYENQAATRLAKSKEKYNITHLFRTPNLRLKTLCIAINWFMCGSCFFGLVQYVGHIDGNIFINVAVSAAMELPGTIIVLLLISRVSRLKILIGGNVLSGVSLLLITLVTNANIRVFLASLGLVGMAISFPTVYLYSSEVFPTVVRNVGVGLGSISARIGSMIAPYIATMGTIQAWLPPVVFGIGPIIGAVLCLLLPETMNCELPETIEDGENFGKKNPKEENTTST